jgi:hypothetical protein
MAGAFVKVCKPGTLTTIAVPPPNRQGRVKYDRVFFSLATDTMDGDPVHVRYEFGAAGDMEVHSADLSTGRSNVHEIDPDKGGRQLITVQYPIGPAGTGPFAPTVCVLVEFETRPDF